MLSKLRELHVRHVHKPIHFELRSVEVLDTECVDCDYFNSAFVADFEYLHQLKVSCAPSSIVAILMREILP